MAGSFEVLTIKNYIMSDYDDDYYNDEPDTRYISKEDARPKHYSSGDSLISGSKQSFKCPSCGSYNTSQGVYFDECNTCDYGQGY